MSLEDMMSGMFAPGRDDPPRPSPAETIRILREAQAAYDRSSRHFTRGMVLRIKPDLHSGMYKSENPVYLFEEYLPEPIHLLDYAHGLREASSSNAATIRDAVVLALDDDNETVRVVVDAAWFEEAV